MTDGKSIRERFEAERARLARERQDLAIDAQRGIVATKDDLAELNKERAKVLAEFKSREDDLKEVLSDYREFQFKPKGPIERDQGVGAWVTWFMLNHAKGGENWTMDRAILAIMESRSKTYPWTAQKTINRLVKEGLLFKNRVNGESCITSILYVEPDENEPPLDLTLVTKAKRLAETDPDKQPESPEDDGDVDGADDDDDEGHGVTYVVKATDRQLDIIEAIRKKLEWSNDELRKFAENGRITYPISKDDADALIAGLSNVKVDVATFAPQLGSYLMKFLGDKDRVTMKTKEVEWMRQGHGLTREELDEGLIYLTKEGVVATSWRSDGLLVAKADSRVADEIIKTETKPLFDNTEIPDHA